MPKIYLGLFVMTVILLSVGQSALGGAAAFCSNTPTDQPLIVETFANGTQWSFCWDMRATEGLIIRVAFFTTREGVERLVLYRASLAQMFVPYDAGSERWHDLDGGLGSASLTTLSDVPDTDCPPAAAPESRVLLKFGGANVVCKEKLDRGLALKDPNNGIVRRGEALVVWSSSQYGNYDYNIRWVFQDDGTVRPELGITGYPYPWGGPPNPFTHVHSMTWRLDFDLAGAVNDAVERFTHDSAGTGVGTDSVAPFPIEAEDDINSHVGSFRNWFIKDKVIKNAFGKNISYELIPNVQGMYRGKTDGTEGFTLHDFRVTRYNPCELYASDNNNYLPGCPNPDVSTFVNGEFTDGADIVVWYSIHFHHLVREAEDFPQQLLETFGPELRPFNFFDKNPLLP